MDVLPDDRLATSVFAVGLSLGFVRREDVVRWADRRIEELNIPPVWLIDLSLSLNLHLSDLTSLLQRVGHGADPAGTVEAILALLPPVAASTVEEAERIASRLYDIAYECFNGEWDYPLLAEADRVLDAFEFDWRGYPRSSAEEAVKQLHAFIERHRNRELVKRLWPVTWVGHL
jgi:hypothetical protein